MYKYILVFILLLPLSIADKQIAQFSVEESSAKMEHLDKNLQDYINGKDYPQAASYVDLPFESATIRGEKKLDTYLNIYFADSDINDYFYSLSKEKVQNIRYLESLLISNKKILVFMNISEQWKENTGNILNKSAEDKSIDFRGVVVTGFDHHARYFIIKDEAKTIWASYDYVAQNIESGFYSHKNSSVDQMRNVNFEITRWAFGKGNIFKPKARVFGTVTGHPAFIKWLRIVVEFSGKKRLVLKQIAAKPNDKFTLRSKYNRFGSRYGILECLNSDFEVTRFIKRKVDK
ncbi:hypothetical protein [Candidatus Uabimicrobium sp. HlEnr_7]|uniref:hypothetical protein n=1 Tax=Candidatus Uabimicrobium helgolandensis TaxID=3095367 RepID=UPI0035573EAF